MSLRSYLFKHTEWNIKPDDIVVDLGSGGDPIFRADLLVDKYIDTDYQRQFRGIWDRPTVCADGAHLPFEDKSIDFLYCSHVIEHIPEPAPFLNEIQRVAKRGLIEAPHGDYEKIHPRSLHLWHVYADNGLLRMVQKSTGIEYPEIAEMYAKVRRAIPNYYDFIADHWQTFNTSHLWEGELRYSIDQNGPFPESEFTRTATSREQSTACYSTGVKALVRKATRYILLRDNNAFSILRCPACGGEIRVYQYEAHCAHCKQLYDKLGNVVFIDR
jgi:SAM-dependent methyltransferase